ncbi:MAG: sulfotransferase domain-containing protein [Mariniblastus sp.]
MPKPTFINIGPGRCATSWLFQLLQSHPEIALSKVKETEYFNTNLANGQDWYESQFEQPSDESAAKAIGEFSANYYLSPEIASAIKAYDPNLKLIINVRDPFDLLKSFHSFGIRRGLEIGEIGNCLNEPIGPIMGSGYSHRKKRGELTTCDDATLLESVCLEDRLKPFFELFPSDQIYLFVVERLSNEHSQVLEEVFEFLGVDATYQPEGAEEVINSAITPKSKLLARAATSTSFLLRRMGANGLLTRLHQSKLIKRLLYSENNAGGEKSETATSAKPGIRHLLDSDSRSIIENQIELLKTRIPDLREWWS